MPSIITMATGKYLYCISKCIIILLLLYSVDVEKNLFTAAKSYSLITNTHPRPYLSEENKQWNLPAQSLILPARTLLQTGTANNQQGQQYIHQADRSTIEHHTTTDQ